MRPRYVVCASSALVACACSLGYLQSGLVDAGAPSDAGVEARADVGPVVPCGDAGCAVSLEQGCCGTRGGTLEEVFGAGSTCTTAQACLPPDVFAACHDPADCESAEMADAACCMQYSIDEGGAQVGVAEVFCTVVNACPITTGEYLCDMLGPPSQCPTGTRCQGRAGAILQGYGSCH